MSMDNNAMRSLLKERGALVENYLQNCLKDSQIPERLKSAMYYSLLAGGKRLRPVLCLTTARLNGANMADVLPFASAIEMIHTYSLIHDDLPAMDDDDLRRGKPSNHKAFDEATAILAGDALLTDSFAFMAESPFPPRQVLSALSCLAKAAGSGGMVGGQVLDMQAPQSADNNNLASLQKMHSLKTGALLCASCMSGAILSGADTTQITALEEYGKAFGVAFQIMDDVLDITADTATLGKPAGSDIEQGKTTYPALMGLEKSQELAQEYCQKAIASLAEFEGQDADFLRALALYVVTRTH